MKRTEEEKTELCLKRWRTTIPLLVIVLSLLAILAMGCVPHFPTGEEILQPPAEEEEKVKSWVWYEKIEIPEALSFQVSEEENGIMMYLNGYETKVIKDGDEFLVLSLRKRVSAKMVEEEWKVYLDGEECGVFIYE